MASRNTVRSYSGLENRCGSREVCIASVRRFKPGAIAITSYKPTSRYQSRVSESIDDGVLIGIKVNSHVPEDPL